MEMQNRVSAALQRLCGAKEPGQLLAAQSDVTSAFLHGASHQTRNALELVEKLQKANITMQYYNAYRGRRQRILLGEVAATASEQHRPLLRRRPQTLQAHGLGSGAWLLHG